MLSRPCLLPFGLPLSEDEVRLGAGGTSREVRKMVGAVGTLPPLLVCTWGRRESVSPPELWPPALRLPSPGMPVPTAPSEARWRVAVLPADPAWGAPPLLPGPGVAAAAAAAAAGMGCAAAEPEDVVPVELIAAALAPWP